ncbi:unnamed protein product [Spirodela intermedia]|uniref:Uncharacterized protein n=1 Tax=Spirodela intermedia TaxID=51605 RepID=A0A7I8J7E9_SPIIN|nr:unnamed protein product [Spirodela intermedia]CAA6666137.1 unnamed protein product [Spirodela intermedia]
MEALVHTILERKQGKVADREQTGGGEGGFWGFLGLGRGIDVSGAARRRGKVELVMQNHLKAP